MHLPSLPPPALPPVLLLPPQLALWFLLWKYYPPPHHSKAVAPSRLSVSAAHPQPPAPVTRANRTGGQSPTQPRPRSPSLHFSLPLAHRKHIRSRLEPSNAPVRGFSPLLTSLHLTPPVAAYCGLYRSLYFFSATSLPGAGRCPLPVLTVVMLWPTVSWKKVDMSSTASLLPLVARQGEHWVVVSNLKLFVFPTTPPKSKQNLLASLVVGSGTPTALVHP
eukprot:RCo003577